MCINSGHSAEGPDFIIINVSVINAAVWKTSLSGTYLESVGCLKISLEV